MADIAAGDVTHTVVRTQSVGVAPRKVVDATITFGDGALTYPAGGIPITKANLGLPNVVELAEFVDMASGDGYLYKYDLANNKIRFYRQTAATGALVEFPNNAVAATTLKMRFSGW